jgi:hypothetical protein
MRKRLNDTHGLTGINHVLNSIEDGEMLGEESILARHKGVHYNLWEELPHSERWSHKFYGKRGAIDHLLLPPTLFDGKRIDYINNSFSVFKAPYLFQKKGWLNSWAYSAGKHKGKGYSDHLPIYALFSTRAYQKEKKITAATKKIEALYQLEELGRPVKLEGCVVILKRGDNAIIKQRPDGRAIYLYRTARALKEGFQYDITVNSIKTYNGLKEITGIAHVKKQAEVSPGKYYKNANLLNSGNLLLQNEVFVNLTGLYRKGKLEIGGKKIPIYFKRKKWIPREGSQIKILYAHLGYYRKVQLVIHDRKDFTIGAESAREVK